jgi:hypothetical protein
MLFDRLHSKHEGTTFPGVVLPPRDSGTTWSIVSR